MTKDTKKSKLKQMFQTFNRDNISSDKRAQDILNAIRNSKKTHEVKLTIAVRQAMTHMTQSEIHRLVANEADHAERKSASDFNG
jgi:hypothetical protein